MEPNSKRQAQMQQKFTPPTVTLESILAHRARRWELEKQIEETDDRDDDE
jgi:hypothetical protein